MKSLDGLLITWYELSDKPLPQWLKRKCDSDPSLQDRLRMEQSLTAELKHGVEEKVREPNPFLKERILRAIDEADRIPEQTTPWLRGAVLAGSACLVAALVWQVSVLNVAENDLGDFNSITLYDIAKDAQSDWIIPLDQEIEYVVSDARGALDFIASNFLPSSMLAANEAEIAARDV